MNRSVNPPEVFPEKCIRCGQCVLACPSFVLELVEEKAEVVKGTWCIGCGHCGAVCPTGAVLHGAPFPDRLTNPGSGPAVSPDQLELLLQERRSVRNYTEDPVPQDLLVRVLNAGSYAPTGTNSQNVHYIVLTTPGQISQLKEMTIGFYDRVFSRARGWFGRFLLSWVAGRKTLEYLRESLPKVEHAYEEMRKGRDHLFYQAPAIILTHAESWDSCSSFNCSVALYHSSLVAHTLGLGCCFNGFLVNAVNHDRKIKRWLAIPPDHGCYSAMTLGFRKLQYRRLIHRESPRATWR